MVETSPLQRNLYALLIGVDYYQPNLLPDGGRYPSLAGCVRDISHVETFLKERLELTDEQVIKLTSTDNKDGPLEPKERWPTYENMVDAFQEITRRAKAGDQVYIHYSGHGGRTITAFPEIKGDKALDESLVPLDIGSPGARYLRDVEIAHLLKQMTDKNLIVTVVFDSCHSGGATRGIGDGAVRGISSIDTTERPTDSLVASAEELKQTWMGIPSGNTRSAALGSGWFPEMENTVLLAACRANELANEFAFEGRERNGALTYWLLDSLKQLGSTLTFSMLHDKILAKVHAKFPQQTPQLHGDGARVVLEASRSPRPPSARVLQVDAAGNRILIGAGPAQGVGPGAIFAIFGRQATDFTKDSDRLALAEVKKVQGADSWADLREVADNAIIEEGAQAVLLDAGSVRLKGRVQMARRDDLPKTIDQEKALERLAQEIQASKWIRLAQEGEGADFQAAVNANGEYEVWEASGQLIGNLRPALKAADDGAAAQMAQRLVHLTKYNNVKLIENSASTSTLARQVKVEIVEEGARGPGGEIIVDDGETLTFRITNNSPQDLNITLLDLQPDWGIVKLYPPDADSELLSSKGQPLELGLQFKLPESYKEGLDTIKMFATIGNTNFSQLELPQLDHPPAPRSGQTRSATPNPLEQLMADFAADAPPENRTRAVLASVSVAQWTTTQIDVQVRRRPQSIKHVRDISTSLLQSAFEEVAAERGAAARGGGAPSGDEARPSIADPAVAAITDYLADPSDEPLPSEGAKRGLWDTGKYCAGLAAGMAKEFWNAHVKGDRAEYDAYKAALTAKFGDCDPRFSDAVTRYAEFLLKSGQMPYRPWKQLSDSVIDGKLPANASIGLVADWGTGQPEAIDVLKQVRQRNPNVVIHLGDIYYAGTAFEVENYFYKPWQQVLEPEVSGITSLALPGNHDLYSGGQPFYDLIAKFGQQSSYFCLRNDDWQLIGLDTALNDRLTGPPTSLDPTEVEWLRDKIENAGNRRTALLSHHQLFSTNERFAGESYNANLYEQLRSLLPKVDIWLWGHEHDLVIFGEHMGLKRGRCIGGSAFPVGKHEMPSVQKNPEVPFNKQVLLSKGAAFYQHCYAMMRLDGPRATVDYYEDSDGGRLLFSESL